MVGERREQQFVTDATSIERRVVMLDKSAHYGKLGISLKPFKKWSLDDDADTNPIGAFVSAMTPGGAADASGAMFVGDVISEIDGVSVKEIEYKTIIEMLQMKPTNPTLLMESTVKMEDQNPLAPPASTPVSDRLPARSHTRMSEPEPPLAGSRSVAVGDKIEHPVPVPRKHASTGNDPTKLATVTTSAKETRDANHSIANLKSQIVRQNRLQRTLEIAQQLKLSESKHRLEAKIAQLADLKVRLAAILKSSNQKWRGDMTARAYEICCEFTENPRLISTPKLNTSYTSC
jgi:hypothetical protein